MPIHNADTTVLDRKDPSAVPPMCGQRVPQERPEQPEQRVLVLRLELVRQPELRSSQPKRSNQRE